MTRKVGRGRVWGGVVLAALLLLSLGAGLAGTAAGATLVELSVRMPGGPVQVNTNDQPYVVAAIWHLVTVDLSSPVAGTVTLKAAVWNGRTQDMTNTYEWIRSEAGDTWTDSRYGTFVDPSLSTSDGQRLVFGVGVDGGATPGAWTLEVRVDTAIVATRPIEVRSPRLQYGLAAADFAFRVSPFQSARVSSAPADQYLRIANQGNVPLSMAVSFDLFQPNLALENLGTIAFGGANERYFLAFETTPRPPMEVNVQGLARVRVAYLIPSPGSGQIVPTFEQTFRVTIRIGHEGYALKTVGNVAFETIDSLAVQAGALAVWNVYLSGGQKVSVDISVTGAQFIGLFLDGTRLDVRGRVDELFLSLTRQLALSVQVKTTTPGTATVGFTFHLLETDDRQTFQTTLHVRGGASPLESGGLGLLWIAGALVAAGMFAIVGFGQLRQRGTSRGRASRRRRERARAGAGLSGSDGRNSRIERTGRDERRKGGQKRGKDSSRRARDGNARDRRRRARANGRA
jgi:hypothetical protein